MSQTNSFNNQITEQEEQKQNNISQIVYLNQDSLQAEDIILDIINNQFCIMEQQNNHLKITQLDMQNILSQYLVIDESFNGISSYVKLDGSSAIRFNIFCSFQIIEQILFSIKSKIFQVYYEIENFDVLLMIDSWFATMAQQNSENFNQQFYSQQIPLENLLEMKFENQQQLFNELGLVSKKQLLNYSQIKNQRLKFDLIDSFEYLDEKFNFFDKSLKSDSYLYYTQSENLNLLEGLIIGPQGTPFEGLIYTLKISIPEQYPYQPPQICFNQQITHQNINEFGEICLDILMDQWSSVLTLKEILIKIVELLKQSDQLIKLPYQQNSDLYKMVLKQEYILQGNQNIIIDYQKQQQLNVQMDYQEFNESYNSECDDEYIE
ncbi:hypothetical protein ABPG74_017573 [Tetrahymena malaccensis]